MRYRKLLLVLAVAVFSFATVKTAHSFSFGTPKDPPGSGGWSSTNVIANCTWTSGTSSLDGAIYTIDQEGECTFSGTVANGETHACSQHIEYNLGTAPACTQQGKNFVVNISAQCQEFDPDVGNLSVTGTLTCPSINLEEQIGLGSQQGNTAVAFDANDCSVFGGLTAVLLSHRLVFTDSTCSELVSDTTATNGMACHADLNPDGVICATTGNGPPDTNTGSTTKPNQATNACEFNDPWNGSCTGPQNNNKDAGLVKGYWLPTGEEGSDTPGVDIASIDKNSVTLNGVPANKCQLKQGRLECSFPSCDGEGNFIAPDLADGVADGVAPVTMDANFGTNNQFTTCSGEVSLR
jgi:hypothetical protein